MTIESKNEYKWAANVGYSKFFRNTAIDKVVEELNIIQETHGSISPENIVECAKNKKSVLHQYFNWDDEKAAHSYRMGQATTLLSRIEVKIIKDEKPIFIKAFENISVHREHPKSVSLDNMSSADIVNIRKIFLSDLKGIYNKFNRFDQYEDFKRAASYIEWAIKILSELSTETENKLTELKAVS